MDSYKKRISVKGLFFDDENRVLLIKGKSFYQGTEFWSVPGGGIEEGESLADAAERELVEETGYKGKVDKIIFVQDLDFSGFITPERRTQLEVFFKGKIIGFDETITPDHKFKFFSEEEYGNILLLPKKLNPFALGEGLDYHNERN